MTPRLTAFGWSAADIGMAVFAQGVLSLANASHGLDDVTDDDALRSISAVVERQWPRFRLQVRPPL